MELQLVNSFYSLQLFFYFFTFTVNRTDFIITKNKVVATNVAFLFSDGRLERVMFDKITSRIQKLCYGLNSDFVDPVSPIPLSHSEGFVLCTLVCCH